MLTSKGRALASCTTKSCPPTVRPAQSSRRHVRAAVAERLHAASHELDISHLNGMKVIVSGVDRDGTATASTSGHGGRAPAAPRVRTKGRKAADAQTEPVPNCAHAADAVALSPSTVAMQHASVLAVAGHDSGSGHGGDKDLGQELKNCEHVSDVLDILRDESGRMSAFTAVQAALRLLALLRYQTGGHAEMAAMRETDEFKHLCSMLSSLVPTMNRAQLCNSTYALACLGHTFESDHAKDLFVRARELAGEMNARDLTMLLHGCATATLAPGRDVLDLLGFRAKVLLEARAFEPQGVSMLLHALATLNYKNTLLLREACATAADTMDQFTPQGVANVVWALGRLGHFSHALLERALEVYIAKADRYKPQETCNMLTGLTALRYHPQAAFPTFVRSLAGRAGSLRPMDFAALFHALGMFAVHPGRELLSTLTRAMEPQLSKFGARELCSCYWGLGLIGEARHPLMAAIGRRLPDMYEDNRMDEMMLRQAFQGLLATKLAESEAEASQQPAAAVAAASASERARVKFPPLMLDAMKRAWVVNAQRNTIDKRQVLQEQEQPPQQQQGQATAKRGGKGGSGAQQRPFKQEVAQMVSRLGVRHQLARPTRDGLVSVDVALNPNKERFVALQIVTEHEHTSNTGQFLGPLQFQSALLEVNGWEVAYLRAKDLKALAPAARPAFIAEKLRSLGCRVKSTAGAPLPAGGPADRSSARGGEEKGGLEMLMDSVQTGGRPRRS